MAGQHEEDSDPEPSHAGGRRHLLGGLRAMSAGDVVFLPKSPDDGHFMVATVTHPYACDCVTGGDETDARNDGQPVIGVDETMRYAYGAGTLYPDIFAAPIRETIRRLSEDDPSYHTRAEFLRSWGR